MSIKQISLDDQRLMSSSQTTLSSPSPKLDTHDALRYIWLCWRYLGMLPFMQSSYIYYAYSVLIIFYGAILFPLFYVISLFVHIDFADRLANLSVALPLLYTTAKQAIIFYYIQGDLQKAAHHLHAMDRRAEGHIEDCAYLKRTVRYCHRIFIVNYAGFWLALLVYGLLGVMSHKLPFEGWLPFDWQHSRGAYTLACTLQMFCFCSQVTNAVCIDTYSVTYLALLVAHLRVLNARIERIGNCNTRTETDLYGELIACVQDHRECMCYYNCIRPAISGTLFVQFLSTALGLCAPAIAFVGGDFDLFQLLKFIIFFFAIIIEVAPCCWFMDEVMAEMRQLTTALFSCSWYEQSPRFRRDLIIFMQRSQKEDKIIAGNITAVSLETFRSVSENLC
ncbi:PREDICTED: odorant receptor 2a-like [Rhagoletis zephyria]|uniref:odorant receptor 2a-like n=1 Tax=Rhagoletis zephyria TaxID=28612 RepID=UPI0008114372|nr:PREDICTED: odorant receptor 2a-like [Rhagoletis zephyria]